MRASVTDARALAGIAPSQVVGYLRANGWRLTELLDRGSAIWESPEGQREVLVPADSARGDYVLRMAEVLAALEATDGRSQLDVLLDLRETGFDVVRFALSGRQFDDGRLPLTLADSFVHYTREAVLAAACAVDGPKAAWGNHKPHAATDYLNRMRFGQTEAGSFVLTLHSPVAPTLQAAMWAEDAQDVPFDRRVMLMLQSASVHMAEAAATAGATGQFQPFEDAIPAGVSANLCEAFVGLLESGDVESLGLAFSFSRMRPTDEQPTNLTVSRHLAPVLREASAVFRRMIPITEFELEGFVTMLRREHEDPVGTVRVVGFVENRYRSVSMELSSGDYALATAAHKDDQRIRCVGELSREGRGHVLRKAHDLVIVPDDDQPVRGMPPNSAGRLL